MSGFNTAMKIAKTSKESKKQLNRRLGGAQWELWISQKLQNYENCEISKNFEKES